MLNRLARLIRYFYLKLIRIKDNPHKLALGLAVGVFVGCTPTFPVQTYISLALAFLLRCSKLGAVAGIWVSNPLNLPAFYYASFVVGRWVLGSKAAFKPLDYHVLTLINEAHKAFKVMMVGGIIIGIPAGLVTYLIFYKILVTVRKRRETRRPFPNQRPSSHPRPS